jgi:hypothetical protein
MGSIYDWSTTASDNGAADATVNYAEGQTPASLNNSARAVMARVAAWLKGLGAAITHGGTSNAYTLTLATGHQITAYATGMRFLWKPNGNSSGSVTLNVDGVGAKKVYLPTGTQAGSGHIASGTLLDVVYDATLDAAAGGFQIVGSSSATGAQAADPGLTALAALSWASGTPLFQATAADTYSLTLTPSVTSVTATQTTASSYPLVGKNTADNANNAALKLESDRATPGAFDRVYMDFVLSDSAGNQDTFGRISVYGATVTSGSEAGQFQFEMMKAGAFTSLMYLSANGIAPQTNDGLSLGFSAGAWSDLFLASGATLNLNASNVVLTHNNTQAVLEATTGALVSPIKLSTETSGTLTSASRNRRVKATAGVTINDGVFTAEDSVEIYNDSDVSITITQDTGMTLRLAGSTSTGNRTLAARGIAYVYFDTNSDAAVAGSGVS